MKATYAIWALILVFGFVCFSFGMDDSDTEKESSFVESVEEVTRSRSLSLAQLECGQGHPVVIPQLGEMAAALFLPGPNGKKVKQDLAHRIDSRLKRHSQEVTIREVLSRDATVRDLVMRQSFENRTPSPQNSEDSLRSSGESNEALRQIKEQLQGVVMESIEEYMEDQRKVAKKVKRDLTANRLKFRLALLALVGTTITAIATTTSTVLVAIFT